MENTSNNNNEYTVILINNNDNDNDEEAAASDEEAETVESNWCCNNKRCGMFVVGVFVVVLMAPKILPYLPEPVPELLLGFLLLLVLVACLLIIDAGFLRNGEMYVPPGGYYSRYF